MPKVGVDEWVARVEQRREQRGGPLGSAQAAWERVPPAAQLALFAVLVASVPFVTDSDFVIRVGVNTLLLGMLALGLNIVVGWAGLLDLGYIAFYGFGAYTYALLASDQIDVHLSSWLVILIVVVASALLGLLLGLPSRRLIGDYLAIVTLFFGQVFVELVVNLDRVTPPGADEPLDITGGPNGIADIDANDVFGYDLTTRRQQYWFILAVVLLVLVGLHFLSESRTGRAWRALREDPLAAEAMSIPVNRLKLMAFAFGAGIAGLAGCIFAAVLTAVTSGNFALPILITIYAIVILGGIGSLTGVVIGAIVINVSFQFLAPENSQENARILFYALIVLFLVASMRPLWKLAAVLGGVVAFGLVAHTLAEAISPSWTAGTVIEGGRLAGAISSWVIIPAGHDRFANVAYIALVVAILVLTRIRGWWRTLVLVPSVYLAAVVWETSFVEQPAVARWILFGSLLVVLMTVRPQGLLGTPRVEIV